MQLPAVRWFTAVAVASGLVYGQASKMPAFEDYSVATVYRGVVKPPNFGPLSQYDGTDLRCFGGKPADYAAERVNFAGHFVVGACTCGSGCHYLFMWDAEDGRFYHDLLPFRPIDVGPFGRFGSPAAVYYPGEQYRVDSTLLILDACFEETCDCAKRYYVWTGVRFDLVLRQAHPNPPGCRNK
jgi:hypothetical protein